jgi:5-(carboxyamino)imidazole ribonucleotide mutase
MSKVAVMGSISDMPVMQKAIEILKGFDIEIEVDIVSAHRTPENYSISVKCTHTWISVILPVLEDSSLPGMVASMSPLPVIGVPEIK